MGRLSVVIDGIMVAGYTSVIKVKYIRFLIRLNERLQRVKTEEVKS